MNTVGSMLKAARLNKGLSLEQVESATKIRLKFLRAIEHDDYKLIPSVIYAKGFIKNYSTFIGLNSDTMMAFFRRQTEDVTRQSILPKGVDAPLKKSIWHLTPSRFIAIVVGVCALAFLTYFAMQYQRLGLPPNLSIEQPVTGVSVKEKKIDIFGGTDPDATVTVNGVSVLVRSDGKYFDQVSLVDGENSMTVTATSRYGKSTTKTIKVKLIQ